MINFNKYHFFICSSTNSKWLDITVEIYLLLLDEASSVIRIDVLKERLEDAFARISG